MDNIAVSNTSTETTLFQTVIKGGSMGTGKELHFQILCTLSTGLLPPGVTIKVKLGSAVLTVASTIGLATSLSSAAPFIIEGKIVNKDAANAQLIYAKLIQKSSSLPLLLSSGAAMEYADWTVNTAADQTFAVTAQFASASTAATLTFKHASIEMI